MTQWELTLQTLLNKPEPLYNRVPDGYVTKEQKKIQDAARYKAKKENRK